MVKLRERQVWMLEGASAFARKMGVSPQHVRQVYLGLRKSPRIEAALAREGITLRHELEDPSSDTTEPNP